MLGDHDLPFGDEAAGRSPGRLHEVAPAVSAHSAGCIGRADGCAVGALREQLEDGRFEGSVVRGETGVLRFIHMTTVPPTAVVGEVAASVTVRSAR